MRDGSWEFILKNHFCHGLIWQANHVFWYHPLESRGLLYVDNCNCGKLCHYFFNLYVMADHGLSSFGACYLVRQSALRKFSTVASYRESPTKLKVVKTTLFSFKISFLLLRLLEFCNFSPFCNLSHLSFLISHFSSLTPISHLSALCQAPGSYQPFVLSQLLSAISAAITAVKPLLSSRLLSASCAIKAFISILFYHVCTAFI